MQVIDYKKPYDRFLNAIDNEKTRHEYESCLRLFMEEYHVTNYDELLKLSTEQVEDMVIEYILSMKKKSLSEGLITQRCAAIRKFFSSNRINLNWDFINQHKGKFKKKQKLEAYNREQIEKLLEICDHRTRCIVLMFASTGIRVSALSELRKKHLKRIGSLYEFTIYENEEEEYTTFCTPECAVSIDNYFEYRERAGEVISEDTFLIRREFDSEDLQQVRSECIPVSASTIRNVMSKRLVKAGIRKIEHDTDTTHRKNIPIDHGFRMFYCSQLVNANLNTEKRYLLEGHCLRKNDPSYIRVKEQLHDEYIKAIDLLTIDKTNILEKQVTEQKQQLNEVEVLKLEYNNKLDLVLQEKKKLEDTVAQLTRDVGKIQQDIQTLHNPPEVTHEEIAAFVNDGIVPDKTGWKYDGNVKRRGTVAFVDSEGDSKKPICPGCEEKGFDSRANMVPYINVEGLRDDNFRRCSTCGDIVPIHELKYESELEDFVDVETANKPAVFEVAEKRRTFERSVGNNNWPADDIPKLARGREDKDLENMLRDRPGIITYLNDDDIQDQDGDGGYY